MKFLLCLALSTLLLEGCASGPTIQISAVMPMRQGEISLEAPAYALAKVAEAVKKNHTAGAFIANYSLCQPSVPVFRRTIIYDRRRGILSEHDDNGMGPSYNGVTDDMLIAVAERHGRVQDVETYGALYVRHHARP